MSGWKAIAADVVETRYGSLVGYGILLTSHRQEAEDRDVGGEGGLLDGGGSGVSSRRPTPPRTTRIRSPSART